jgi:hypothetical protein
MRADQPGDEARINNVIKLQKFEGGFVLLIDFVVCCFNDKLSRIFHDG